MSFPPAPRLDPPSAVLLLEDDELTRWALAAVLEGHDWRVCPAATVAEALDCLRNVDGVAHALLDLNLPDGVGLDVMRQLRKTRPWVRVAVITGTDDDWLLNAVSDQPPDHIFRKPIVPGDVLMWLGDAQLPPRSSDGSIPGI